MSNRGPAALPILVGVGGLALAAFFLVWTRPAAEPPLRGGAEAPGFELERLEGGEFSLAEARGKVVFVNFWATWCAPCLEEAPSLDRLYRKLRDEGFVVAAVSVDEADAAGKVAQFRSEHDLSFPILLDPEKQSYQAYQASGVPETFMIDPEGRVVERFIGPRDWNQPRYSDAVRRLLGSGAGLGGE